MLVIYQLTENRVGTLGIFCANKSNVRVSKVLLFRQCRLDKDEVYKYKYMKMYGDRSLRCIAVWHCMVYNSVALYGYRHM